MLPKNMFYDGYLLFAHGSALATWQEHFVEIVAAIRQKTNGFPSVIGFLERAQPDFHTALDDLIWQIKKNAEGDDAEKTINIQVIPLFLAHSNHTAVDLPALAAQAREIYPNVNINFAQALLENLQFKDLMINYLLQQYFREN